MPKGCPGPRPHLRIPFADRFWAKVARARFPNGALDYGPCWDWLGKTTGTQNLTGSIRLPAPSPGFIVAPRAALLLWEGVQPEALESESKRRRHLDAGHTICDRPQCCNPTHLAWQPHKANIHEYIRKFGQLAGRAVPNAANY